MVRQGSAAKLALSHQGRKPGLVFQPRAYDGMQKGINIIAEAVRPTLGPLPRRVAIDPVSRGNTPPELLDHGALLTQTKRNKGAAGWDKMAGWETKENVQIGENSGGYGRGI